MKHLLPYLAALTVLLASPASHAGSVSYTYDALGRLKNAVSGGTNAGYQYDPLGNFTVRTIASPPQAQPTVTGTSIGVGSVTFTFTVPPTYTGAPITGFVASCSPGALTGSASASATSITVSGLVRGSSYSCTVAPDSAVGQGLASATQTVVGGSQTITFASLGVLFLGLDRPIPVTASSGLAISLTSSTPSVCTVVSGLTVRGLSTATCALTANQAGDSNFLAAPAVSVNIRVLSPGVLFILLGDE